MKSVTKEETKLRKAICDGGKLQGWLAEDVNDRFKAGKPDMRLGHIDFPQIDVELKYSLEEFEKEYDVGLKKIQWLKIRDRNRAGMPAVCLVYSLPLNLFFITTLLRDTLPPPGRCIKKLPDDRVIDLPELHIKTMRYLQDECGYRYPSYD